MIGFIYHITNIETNKKYIGQTLDIERRIYRHFKDLEDGTHHSQKLQRSYNVHGKTSFQVTYNQVEINSYEELLLLEQKEIQKYDSYNNGYNETLGGEGHPTRFDFDTSVLLYQIGLRYNGVKHKIADYYGCDRTTLTAIFNKSILGIISYDEDKLNNLIQELGLTDEYLKENYKDNYTKQLSLEQVLKIFSTIEIKKFSAAACGRAYGVKKDVVNCITKGKTYKIEYAEFLKLTQYEKEKYAEQMCNETDVVRLHYQGQRGNVKNPLTQEQVDFILDNKNTMKKVDIAKQLGISTDRVSSVCNNKSYLDMIWWYNKTH